MQKPQPYRAEVASKLLDLADRVAFKSHEPTMMLSEIEDSSGHSAKSKDSWLPLWGTPTNANLRKVVQRYESDHSGETVLSAEVVAPNGDTKATYQK